MQINPIESFCVLGVDPGLANFGWTLMNIHKDKEEIVGLGVFHTDKSNKKTNVKAADDNLRRLRIISSDVRALVDQSKASRVRLICVESMSFPRNASAAAKMAMSWGVIATFSEMYEIPILCSTPQEIKLAVAGAKNATKESIESAILARYPESADLASKIKKIQREHAFDSAAAIVSCLKTDEMRIMRSICGSMTLHAPPVTPQLLQEESRLVRI